MSKETQQSFVKGAAILGVAAVIIKVIGAFFRIPLANMLGDEGMSFYQTAYPFYIWLTVISTAGLPAAIAKIIAEKRAEGNYRGAKKVFKIAMILMTSIGAVGMIAMLLGAVPISTYVKNEGAFYSFIALAPAILFVSMMSAMRGYFQGIQEMRPYAISQVVEQLFRVFLGLGLASMLASRGLELSSAGATFGASAGGFFGFAIIGIMYLRHRKQHTEPETLGFPEESTKSIMGKILKIAVPITIGASVIPLMSMLDLAIIMPRLHSIGIVEQANDMYGQLTGYAQTLVNLPQTITAAVQIALIPAIAAIAVKGNKKELEQTIETGIRLGVIIGLPASLGMVILAEPIMKLLYPMQMDIAASTGAILSILGWGVLFLSIYQVTTGILQGLGKQWVPARNLAVGAVFKGILSYTLVGIPSLNIKGAAIATITTFAIAGVLNMISLIKHSGVKVSIKNILLKPAISGAVMVVFVKLAYWAVEILGMNFLSPNNAGRLATVGGVGIGALVFLVMILATGALTDEDLAMMPGGSKIKRLADKLQRKKAA